MTATTVPRGSTSASAAAAWVASDGAALGPPGAVSGSAPAARVTLPPAVKYAVDLVRAPAELAEAVAELLAGVVVAADLPAAREVLRDHPGLRVVTRDGDLLGAHWAYGGSAHGPSQIEVRAAADETVAKLAEADERCAETARPARGRRRGRGAGAARGRDGRGCPA